MRMTLRTRIALAVLGALLVLLALAALAYALPPLGTTIDRVRPAPTLFVPPVEGTALP